MTHRNHISPADLQKHCFSRAVNVNLTEKSPRLLPETLPANTFFSLCVLGPIIFPWKGCLQLVLLHVSIPVNPKEPQHGLQHLSQSSILFNCQHMPWHGAGSLPASPVQTMPGHSLSGGGSPRDTGTRMVTWLDVRM